ncbi:MAG: 23S rRNA (guanine2445-N2)-methyltransferase / 23S rRNA (guanine2069-N7)-methyltransferase, partial [Flavobacteriales bacterium]
RLGDVNSLSPEYQKLGEVCKSQLAGWQLAVISSNKELLQELRLRPEKKYRLYNGPLECEFRIYQLRSKTERDEHEQNSADKEAAPRSLSLSEGEQMLVNRLKKNQRRLKSWLKKSNITCYRLYDADMPEYSAAIDIYGDKVHIQEYKAPLTIDEKTAELRFKEIVSAVKVHLNAASTSVFTKIRQRNKGKSQYKTIEAPTEQDYFWVEEGAANLRVNLKSYIDTGLFLDHRPLRKIIFNEAKGKRFLNLFCYTATASVHAALGGADRSVSVDMSNTYLEWAKLNYLNNNVSLKNHDLVRADVVEWLKGAKEKYDIIMLDPPSFSNSKKMEATLDIQRDHESFIKQCMAILAPGGSLYFSCNLRGFKFEPSLSESFDCDNILQSSLDLDFERRPKIHHCWKITHQAL